MPPLYEPYGPRTALGQYIHRTKHRAPEETYDDSCVRYARAVCGGDEHLFRTILRLRRDMILLPAGRQQLAVGRPYGLTPNNCFAAPPIEDSTQGIFDSVKYGALTLRAGGGCGWDFSTLRPCGEPIRGLGAGAVASGPVSFMHVWHAMCGTIMSAGERRGAMMGTLRVDHPDILRFVTAKKDQVSLTNFNISVAVTDEFMEALDHDGLFQLRFGDTVFGDARAVDIWSVIMETNWDFAEPGVLFIDRINRLNPLWYCETITTTNPCAEKPLPPNGACLLGSINWARLLTRSGNGFEIDYETADIAVRAAVRAFDNVIDFAKYPLPEQRDEHLTTRRMGIGVTGVANAIEVIGPRYGSLSYLEEQDKILQLVQHSAYLESIALAKERGSFPKFDSNQFLSGDYAKQLPEDVRHGIGKHGLRNGILTSIAPTGTISLAADNVSGGIEPVFQLHGERDVLTVDGKRSFTVDDYAASFYGVEGCCADQVTAQQHIDVLCRAQPYVCSSISKTCNVDGQVAGTGDGVTFGEFKDLYLRAWQGGAKSCTTFNLSGKRMGIMREIVAESTDQPMACVIDPVTGLRNCEE